MPLVLRLLAAVALAAAVVSGPAHAETTRLTVLVMNDIYLMGDVMMPDGKRRGGFARLAAVVKAERERARSSGSHVLLAHGGDTLSPSLMSGIDQGAHIVTLTNLVRPDIFAPGNHEFDFGKDVFLKRMSEANFPLYAANMRAADGTPVPNFKDRSIVTLDGVRVGLTGAAFDDSPKLSSPGDLKFSPSVPAMRREAETLRREGADFVLAVLHAEREQGHELMATQSIDLVVTGHNHDLFINFDGRHAMVESSYDAHYVVAIDVTINVTMQEGRRAASWWPQFRVIDTANVTPDPEVAAAVAGFEAELTREMDVPLGTTAIELDSRNIVVRTREAAMGNLIADAMREKAGAVAAVTNGGGIRGGRVYPPGSQITRRDILGELPFGNRVVTLDVKGSALREALENGLSRVESAAGRFPQVSGITIEYDPKRPTGQRILAISIGGAPLDPDRIYRIATNDFLARGGDGYDEFAAIKPLIPADDSPLIANEAMVHVRRLGTIRTGVEGRIVAK
jgi:2',3'-cyclic-nucleotide 2'-phosphodiesterase (5'-nucleotidase family)